METLQAMSLDQKKKFLSMDLANRMICIEQKLVANVSKKKIKPQETEYYKSLCILDKANYEQYLKDKKKKRSIMGGLIIAPLLALALFRPTSTGNVIVENGTITFSSFELVLMGVFVLLICLFLVLYLDRKLIDHRLNKHVRFIEHILARKYITKNE